MGSSEHPPLMFFIIIIIFLNFTFFKLFIPEICIERGRGRSRLPAGTPRGTGSRDPGVTAWAEGRRSTAEPPGGPSIQILSNPCCGLGVGR